MSPVPRKRPAKKPVLKKPVVKKPVAKKVVAKKLVAKKPVAKKLVAKKPVAKKLVVKKPVARKLVVKKAAVRKAIVKRPVTTAARKGTGLTPPAARKPAPKPAPKPFLKVPPAVQPPMPTPEQPARPPMPMPEQPAKPPMGMGPGIGQEVVRHVDLLRTGLEGKTNQDIINVIYRAADELKMPGWTLLARAKLEHLVNARTAPYSGPPIASFPDLTSDQKAVILKVLASYVRPGT